MDSGRVDAFGTGTAIGTNGKVMLLPGRDTTYLFSIVGNTTVGYYQINIKAYGGVDDGVVLKTPHARWFVVGSAVTSTFLAAADPQSATIAAADFAAGAIDAAAIATDAIGAAEIAASAIGASEIATDAIGALETASDADMIALSVNNRKFNATFDGLTNDNIDANVVLMQTNTITAASITDGAIGAAEIATDAIGSLELAAGAADEIADSTWGAVRAAPTVSATTFGAALDSLQDLGVKLLPITHTGATIPTVTTVTDSVTVDLTNLHVPGDSAWISRQLGRKIWGIAAGSVGSSDSVDAGSRFITPGGSSIQSTSFSASGAGLIGQRAADSVWKALFSARSGVAGSFGDSAKGWGQTGSSTGADSGVVARIGKRMWGIALGVSGSDSTTIAQRTVTVGSIDSVRAVGTVGRFGTGPRRLRIFVLDSATSAAVQGYVMQIRDSATGTMWSEAPATNASGITDIYTLANTTYFVRGAKSGSRFAANADTVMNVLTVDFIDTVTVVTASQILPVVAGKTNLYGYVQDITGDALIDGVEVQIELQNPPNKVECCTTDTTATVVIPKFTAVTRPDVNGRWEFNIYPSASLLPTLSYKVSFKLNGTVIFSKVLTVSGASQRFNP